LVEPGFVHDARRYLAVLHKRRAIVTTCLGVSLVVAVLYNYTTRPRYQASARILIERSSPKVLPTKELIDSNVQDLQTEYELLRGRNLSERVVETLQLQKSQELATGPLMSPWERFQRRFLGKAPTPPVDSQGLPLSPAAAALRSRISVEPLPGGRLVNLSFSAYEPALAAKVANTLAELYIAQTKELRSLNSSEATDWLSDRLAEQRKKVEEAEKAVLEYQEQHGLSDYREGSSGAEDPETSLENAVMSARMERIAKETLLGQVRSLPAWQLASVPAIATSAGVQEARSHVADLQADVSRLGETLGERHPEMVRARSELQAAQEKLGAEVRSALRALEAELQAARAKEGRLEADLAGARQQGLETSRKAIEYVALKREVESNKQLFQSLMSRSKETGLESELKSSNVRIVERAEVPGAPVSPQRGRNYRWAFLIGLGLGIGLALLFEHVDNTVKTPEDVKEMGLSFLGMVPTVEVRPGASGVVQPVTAKGPESAVAEAYRVLRTNLVFSSASGTGRVLVITSPNPGEGKTTTTANLAVALALNGSKVLVVDADLRRPTLHHHFRIGKTPGLSDLIVARAQASEAIQATRFKGLQVLPCGYAAPNPAELLGSANMREILQALRSCYDWVLVDTPPVLAMADTPVLCPLVDGVVLILAAEESPRPAVSRAVDQVMGVGGKVTGVVLNRVDLRRNSYYYGQYYGEYYRSYYAPNAGASSQGRRASSRH
jgi:polysaccharide biosynthesis transport protein